MCYHRRWGGSSAEAIGIRTLKEEEEEERGSYTLSIDQDEEPVQSSYSIF